MQPMVTLFSNGNIAKASDSDPTSGENDVWHLLEIKANSIDGYLFSLVASHSHVKDCDEGTHANFHTFQNDRANLGKRGCYNSNNHK